MTGLRKFAKTSIIFFMAWEVAAALLGLALLAVVTLRGGTPSPESLIYVFGTLGFYGILSWAIRDANKNREAKPSCVGDSR